MGGPLRLRADGVHWRAIEDEVVILDGRAQRYLTLNRSGALLWPLLVEGATREELAGALTRAYPIEAAQAAGDVDALIAELAARSLLGGGP
ncbi:MAG: hypothetical protein QOF77_1811 [Solirubrobacteraceae bacterium]|jgi:hypothetical protein|nr:hypothetical protein [Solirubrobacteraceae bacterium]